MGKAGVGHGGGVAAEAPSDVRSTKPRALVPAFGSVPMELRQHARFVLWRSEEDPNKNRGKGGWAKVPYRADGRGRASTTKDATWATFEAVCAAFERGVHEADGIGWVIGAGVTGGDVDACRDPESGELTREAAAIVAEMNTYAEISPSGTGVRYFAFGTLPPKGRKRGAFEMYDGDGGRYLTLTGHRIEGTPDTIEPRDAELAAIHARHIAPQPRPSSNGEHQRGPATGQGAYLADADVLQRMRSKNATAAALYDGDMSAYISPETGKPDHSAADQALCSHLAFWSDYNAAQIDRLFRASGLMRPKWDRRARQGETYGDGTISRAMSGKRPGDGYRPNTAPNLGRHPGDPGPSEADAPPDAAATPAIAESSSPKGAKPKGKPPMKGLLAREVAPLMTAAELAALDLPVVRPVIEDLIVPGLNVFAGPYKLGKSWLALQMSHQVAVGGRFFNRPTTKGRAIYFALEDGPRRLQSRIRYQGIDAEKLDALMFGTELPRIGAGGFEHLSRILDRYPDTRMVVVDTWTRFRPAKTSGNTNAYDADSMLGDKLQRLAIDRDVALVLVTHVRKMPAEDVFDTITGSVGVPGTADSVIVLKRKRGDSDGVLYVTSRDFDEREDALRFDKATGTWHLLGSAAEYALTKQRRQVYETVRELGVASPSAVAEFLSGTMNHNTVRVTMQRMEKAGELHLIAHGKYTIPRPIGA